MNDTLRILATAGLAAALLAGCSRSSDSSSEAAHHDHAEHDHESGQAHEDQAHQDQAHQDQDHDTPTSLGTATIGTHQVEGWQGHGTAAPGKELHLVLKLAGEDNGTAVVRAWIGSQDRLASIVGKGDFNSNKGVYDIHAETPSPLDPDAKWWVEIETEDGTKSLGSLALHR